MGSVYEVVRGELAFQAAVKILALPGFRWA
jgi:hypothetical protein